MKNPKELKLQVPDRAQMLMRPTDVDKLVDEDHPARSIWRMLESLDLGAFYEKIDTRKGEIGRAAHDPRVLITLWIYSYSRGVSSAREISRLCEFDPAYQWITGMQMINYHSLSDFRVDNKEGLKKLGVDVLGLLSKNSLISLERVAHDGTKIKANASKSSFRRKGKLQACLDVAKKQVEKQDREADQEEYVSTKAKKAEERSARERKERLELALKELEEITKVREKNGKDVEESRASSTDAEARIMKHSDGGFHPSYNLQITTEGSNKIIVGFSVSQERTDAGLLEEGLEEVKKNMGELPKQVLADGGYTSRATILEMDKRKIDLIGPVADRGAMPKGELNRIGIAEEYHTDKFNYDPVRNVFECPKGKLLTLKSTSRKLGYTEYRYKADAKDCQQCPARVECCRKSPMRTVGRREDQEDVAAYYQKISQTEVKEIYKRRSEIAEFPNLWIKEKMKLRKFSLRGLAKVEIESMWVCLTYNIQHALRLLSGSQMVEA